MSQVCVCEICGAKASYRMLPASHGDDLHAALERRMPIGWAREFYSKNPDDPKKNRILCGACNEKVATQRGTVRFIAGDD